MRALEPHHFQYHTPRRSFPAGLVAVVLLFIAALGGGYWYWHGHMQASRSAASQRTDTPVAITPPAPKTTPKILTGNQFKDLYHAVMQAYPNTEAFPEPPAITGNLRADERIRQIAESRGFQTTRIPVTALVKTGEPLVKDEGDDLLQPLALEGWKQIKAAAAADHVPLALLSAYRSPDWQRNLFMQRLLARGVTVQQIADGQGDDAVKATLGMTAVPGFSRHHTGYTVDFTCEDGSATFGASTCFKWLNNNNYLHAKESGWMPSYPAGADEQGPEPEPWEYVWVGKDALYQ